MRFVPTRSTHKYHDPAEGASARNRRLSGGPSLSNADDTAAALRRAHRDLEKAKRRNDELVSTAYQAARDALSSLRFDPVKAPKIRHGKNPEVAVPVSSDWQLGKITPTYSSDVAEERIEVYAEKLIRLTDLQRAAHPVNECRLWLLGDLVEGELIFPGQAHLIDSSLFRQVMVDGPRILAGLIRRLLSHFEKVHVVGVIGNHGALGGRARKDYHPETNADRMLYWFVKELFRAAGEKRVTFDIPFELNERAWFAIDDIGGYRTLLMHGEQLRYGPRAPSSALKVLSWKAGGLTGTPGVFDDVAIGHWHQGQRLRIGTTTLRINGSTESSNTYAQEYMANMDGPSQWLLFVRPGRGVTAEYQVWLGGLEAEKVA